jgi:hypothetical protein
MTCTYAESKSGDEVVFSRSGVKGHLLVQKDGFELRAQLGFLLGAFKHTIEAEIVKNLDALAGTKNRPMVSASKATRARTKKNRWISSVIRSDQRIAALHRCWRCL